MTAIAPTQNNRTEPVCLTPSIADDLRNLNNQLRAKIVSDALRKSAIGAAAGAAFSFIIFKRMQTLNFALISHFLHFL